MLYSTLLYTLLYSPIAFKGVFRYRIRMSVVGVGWVRHSSSYSCRCHNTSVGVVIHVIIHIVDVAVAVAVVIIIIIILKRRR